MRQACERLDRTRDDRRRTDGVLNTAVDLIREVRDDAGNTS
jgi:hypothetical protein